MHQNQNINLDNDLQDNLNKSEQKKQTILLIIAIGVVLMLIFGLILLVYI